jgi:DNA repair protein RadA/Sms
MKRAAAAWRCQQCGFVSPKPGTCPDCKRATGELTPLVEERAAPVRGPRGRSAPAARPAPLTDIVVERGDRVATGIKELDRVLGGGVVRGSLVLIGGDPGIGKSTLLLQAARALADATPPVLYVTAEESTAQVKLRADRLGVATPNLLLWAETDLSLVDDAIDEVKPRALIVDSIQTVFLPGLESAPGSVTQVRECAARLMTIAKGRGLPTFIVGHVTKDGSIAGPRVLEHLVDTVLYFEGDAHQGCRVLRAVKNRFGSTNEIGVFRMGSAGLEEVLNPSGLFLAERPHDAPGSVIVSSLEGTRPVLLELQALVTRASFGTVRRTVLGADYNRVCLLLAVLEKRAGVPVGFQDVFVNVAGGARVSEPAADLGIVLAAASSFMDRPVPADLLVVGEVGLTGEVRAVAALDARLREAATLGFRRALVPAGNTGDAMGLAIEVTRVGAIHEALRHVFDEAPGPMRE